jgi:glycosyltransferase involved in cell wall biosynthesis
MTIDTLSTPDGPTAGTSNGPAISVAISTYQRRTRLPRLIEALEQQTLSRHLFEIIIVDDASTDGTIEVLRQLAEASSLQLRVVRNEQNSGPAGGRNTAWRAARGPIVAFTDDDCVPTPGWLETGLEGMQKGVDILVGRTAPAPDQLHLLGPFSRTMVTTDERYFATCNIFYRREDLEVVDGFDEGFRNKGGEDTDLAYRIRRLGRRVSFVPDALVHHDVCPSSFRVAVKESLRWDGIVRMVARNPVEARREHLWRPYFWKDSHPPVILATIGLLLTPVVPLAVALTLPYLRFRLRINPRTRSRVRRFLVFPGTYIIDVLEVYVMARESVRYRTLVL